MGRHGFIHSVGTLAGGTAFAQALAILALPVMTRLYSPSEFGVLAVYGSLIAIISVAACLRFEVAIPIPRRDGDAANLLALSVLGSFGATLVSSAAILFFPDWIVKQVGVAAIRPYLWMVPLGVWATSSYAAIQFWATRKKKFARIARTRVAQAVGGAGTQMVAGFAGIGAFGLLLGQLVNSGAGVIGLLSDAWREDFRTLRAVSWRSMRRAFSKYSKFPKYSVPDALANNIGSYAPMIIIAVLSTSREVGCLSLAVKVMFAPMGLIGASVAQVYLSRAPEELRNGVLDKFTARVLNGLVKVGVGPLLFAGIVAAPTFAIVFGPEWRRAGEIVGWMTPWFILQFISSPVSMVAYVTGNQKAMLVLTLSGLLLRICPLLLAGALGIQRISESYAVASAAFYGGCTFVFYRLAGVSLASFFEPFFEHAKIVICWVVAGAMVAISLGIILD
jgi:O-antigen/teichoic acid export membrane protein